MSGTLYIVSTPIGNLDDISRRAIAVLGEVDWVAAEDTRHSQRMLEQLGIRSRLISCHDHNESARSEELVARLQSGEQGALISDAGTPLVSDPGYRLVRACHQAGVRVVPIPGASALLAALAAAGQPSDRFLFEGFVPAKGAPRQQAIERLAKLSVTSIIYEAPHRVLSFLEALKPLVEKDREISLCRELTKRFEEVRKGSLAELEDSLRDSPVKGEIVLLVGRAEHEDISEADLEADLRRALETMSVKDAAAEVAEKHGLKKRDVYQMALAITDQNSPQ